MTPREDDFDWWSKAWHAVATRFPAWRPPHSELSATTSRATIGGANAMWTSHASPCAAGTRASSHYPWSNKCRAPVPYQVLACVYIEPTRAPGAAMRKRKTRKEEVVPVNSLCTDWTGPWAKLGSTSLTTESYAAPNGLTNRPHFRLFTSDLMF
ncbi:hypothetical protein MTO96_021295 [Rhipicephalus appendiculatus]